jgi:hypothetical protein
VGVLFATVYAGGRVHMLKTIAFVTAAALAVAVYTFVFMYGGV